MKFKNRCGQSVAENAVLLALILIVVTAILIGIGRHSRDRLVDVNSGFTDQRGARPASGGSAGGKK